MPEIQWVLCPVCRNKTRLKIRGDTILINFPLYCPKCKQTEFGQYVAGFMKAVKKKRIAREPLYRESSLINFMSELGLADTDTTL